jgi:hypothetical protein
MLTKTLKFDNDVLEIVRAMEWNETGTLGIITGGMMTDRKLYERVNKALEAMGGKWNRKARGHVFGYDPRPQVEGLLTNGALTVERDGFFETPPAVVKQMLKLAPLPKYSVIILEPSAGMGAILQTLITSEYAERYSFVAIEKNKQRADYLKETYQYPMPNVEVFHMDFMNYELPKHSDGEQMYQFQRIYMNPPFEEMQDVDHVRHAYEVLQPDRTGDLSTLVSVMSESPFFRTDRKAAAFREWLDEVGGYSVELPDGAFKESGTGVKARLVVIRK